MKDAEHCNPVSENEQAMFKDYTEVRKERDGFKQVCLELEAEKDELLDVLQTIEECDLDADEPELILLEIRQLARNTLRRKFNRPTEGESK